MRYLVKLSLSTVLILGCVLQVTTATNLKNSEEGPLAVNALLPEKGTVVFVAQSEENLIPGVEIRIDGEGKGFTGKDGKLKVEWLLSGNHVWEAIYGGKIISKGEFEIEKITDIKILNRWTEVNGEKTSKLYPLKDTTAYTFILQNTGTTTISETTVKWKFCPTEDMEYKIIRPAIPSRLTDRMKKMVLGMFHVSGGRNTTIRNGMIFINDSMTDNPVRGFTYPFVLYSPQGETIAEGTLPQKFGEIEKGLEPGMTLKMAEAGQYDGYLDEGMRNKACEMKTNINLKILDRENGILETEIKELNLGLMKLKNVKAVIQLKGLYQLKHEMYVGDELCDSVITEERWLCSESDKTLDELLEQIGYR